MKHYLETERIILREFIPSDEEEFLQLDSDPEVMQYLKGRSSTRKEIREMMSRVQNIIQNSNGDHGCWTAIFKETTEVIGWFHLRPDKKQPSNSKRLELGYRLKKRFWGKGLATEGSLSLIDHAFFSLEVNEVFATTMKKNLGSRRVIEKCGLKYSHEFVDENFAGTREKDVWYSIKKSEAL